MLHVDSSRRTRARKRPADSADEFLRRSREKDTLQLIKRALSRRLRQRRARRMTQRELARRIGSSQPRIACSESADGSVSVDLLIRALLATGATPREIGRTISAASL